MIDSIFTILGIDYSQMMIPDTALVVVVAITFLYILDWFLRLLSLIIGTFTKRR